MTPRPLQMLPNVLNMEPKKGPLNMWRGMSRDRFFFNFFSDSHRSMTEGVSRYNFEEYRGIYKRLSSQRLAVQIGAMSQVSPCTWGNNRCIMISTPLPLTWHLTEGRLKRKLIFQVPYPHGCYVCAREVNTCREACNHVLRLCCPRCMSLGKSLTKHCSFPSSCSE